MADAANSAAAAQAIGGLFGEVSQRGAARGSRMVWVFVLLLVLLAVVGFYVFWYLMCLHHGGTASGFRCNCGPHGKYKFFKFGCDCDDGFKLLSNACTGPTTPPPIAATLTVCGDPRGASNAKDTPQCCMMKPTATGIVGAFCGDSPSASPGLLAASAPGIPRFSPTAQQISKERQLQGWLT